MGAGLVRPEPEAVEELVRERFIVAASSHDIRLVILNANGVPGIGQQVASVLTPAGFRLMSSQNAVDFEQATTKIVASTPKLLPQAELAAELLGVGEVYLGRQHTNVADVTVVVGKDFPGR